MNQHDLNREVGLATGESAATIEALGFILLFGASPPFDRRRHMRQQASAQCGKGLSRAPSRPKRPKRRIPINPPRKRPATRRSDIPSPAETSSR